MQHSRGLGQKNSLAALIVTTLMIGLLAGCGGQQPSKAASEIQLGNGTPIEGDSTMSTSGPSKSQAGKTAAASGAAESGKKSATAASGAAESGKKSATAASGVAESGKKSATAASGAAAASDKKPTIATASGKKSAGSGSQVSKTNVVHATLVKLDQPSEPKATVKTKSGAKLVALTFDDGPDNHYTPAILDILKAMKVHATFFTVGTQVKKNASVMKRIRNEGNEIGNHTYSHRDLSKLDSNPILDQIKWTDVLINNQIGYVPRLIRAPYGAVSPLLKQIVKDNQRELVGWTVDTKDWAGSSVAEMRVNVNKNTHPGGIILMHSFGSKYLNNTVKLLPLIIKDLQNKGYTFVTVSELLTAKAGSKPVQAKKG